MLSVALGAGLMMSALLPVEVSAQDPANNAVFIRRTEHEGGDGSKPVTRNGNVLVLDMPVFGVQDLGIGLWFKRDLASDQLTSDKDRTGPFLALYQDNGSAEGTKTFNLIDSSLLPDDAEWHFFFVALDAPAAPSKTVSYNFYIDGSATPAHSGTFEAVGPPGTNIFNEILIGAGGDNLTPGPASINGIVDDVMVWDAIDSSITSQVSDIAVFGMVRFDPGDGRLIYYKDFNDLLSLPRWFEETAVSGTKQTNISQNAYEGWWYDDGQSLTTDPLLDGNAPHCTPVGRCLRNPAPDRAGDGDQ